MLDVYNLFDSGIIYILYRKGLHNFDCRSGRRPGLWCLFYWQQCQDAATVTRCWGDQIFGVGFLDTSVQVIATVAKCYVTKFLSCGA